MPLDFFSWHTYTNDPDEFVRRAQAIRRLLDESGFEQTENHLNEWNYLPDNDWSPMLADQPLIRQAWFDRIHGSEGAAFAAASLIRLQDAPLDAANYYSADIHGFGMFNEHGVPHKNFDAVNLFAQLVQTPARLSVSGRLPEAIAVLAGTNSDRTRYTVLLSNYSPELHQLTMKLVSWPNAGNVTSQIQSLESSTVAAPESVRGDSIAFPVPAHGVVAIHFSRDGN